MSSYLDDDADCEAMKITEGTHHVHLLVAGGASVLFGIFHDGRRIHP